MSSRRGAGRESRGEDAPGGSDQGLQHHLDSENPDTDSVEVARHWIDAYAELVEFEEKVLGRLQELLPTLSESARREAELTNLPMVVQHLQTFRYRRAHWRRQLGHINGQ